MIINKFTPAPDKNYWLKSLNTTSLEPTNPFQFFSRVQRIRYCYKTLGSNVIYSPLLTLYIFIPVNLIFCLKVFIKIGFTFAKLLNCFIIILSWRTKILTRTSISYSCYACCIVVYLEYKEAKQQKLTIL